MLVRGLLVAVLLFSLPVARLGAQETVEYFYDGAGNRVVRKVLIVFKDDLFGPNQNRAPLRDSAEEKRVTIFPNPTRGQLLVRLEGGDDDTYHSILLYGINGALLKTIGYKGNGDIPVDMGDCQPGAYVLALVHGNTQRTYKILKQ